MAWTVRWLWLGAVVGALSGGCVTPGEEPAPSVEEPQPVAAVAPAPEVTPAAAPAADDLPDEPDGDDTLKALEALGYVDRTETANPHDRGVTLITEAAFDGLSLLSSRHRATAELIDNQGRVLHTWAAGSRKHPWMHVELQRNGDIVVLAKDRYVARLDWDSRLIWKRLMRAHHDFTFAPDGRLLVLSRGVIQYDFKGTEIPILEDRIAVLDANGEIVEETSLFPLLEKYVPRLRLRTIRDELRAGKSARDLTWPEAPGDVTHANSLFVLKRPLYNIAPADSVLISVRELDRILILSPDLSEILWEWGEGEIDGQHHATVTSTDNILMFDNGVGRGQSRLLEVNPTNELIEWSFTAEGFFTHLRGAAQKLPNGNVLATVSDRGHVIEVNRLDQVVWEFWNPDVVEATGDQKATRAVIYRLLRYGPDYLTDGGKLRDHVALSPTGGPEEHATP